MTNVREFCTEGDVPHWERPILSKALNGSFRFSIEGFVVLVDGLEWMVGTLLWSGCCRKSEGRFH
jgi:hypothetical protein